jgi:hypothetical protein
MTRLIARLILSMLLLPISGALLLISLFLCSGAQGPTVPLVVGIWLALYAFIASYWLLLWRGVVCWTARRVRLTVLAGLAAVIFGGLVAEMIRTVMGRRVALPAVLIGGGLPPIIWVLATVLTWRETPQERMQRLTAAGAGALSCPICGYNMTGLREARCPECGVGMTLDELVAAQARRDAVALADR